jgi:hypothetical protein
VYEEFELQAHKQGKTLYAFTNETLSMMAKICAEGGNSAQLYDIWHVLSVLRLVDVVILPADFVDDLLAEFYQTNKEVLLRKFSDLGSRLVPTLKVVTEDFDGLSRLAEELSFIIPVKRFKMTSLQESDRLQIEIIGAGRRLESTECATRFLESILNGYGLKIVKEQIDVGTIRVIAQKGYHMEPKTTSASK